MNERKNPESEITNSEIGRTDENAIIPVIEEFLKVGKKVVATGKVHIHKKTEKEKRTVDIPLKAEEYEVKRVAVKTKLLDHPPAISENDGETIIPVVREVAQVVIKYEVTEEIHVIRHQKQTIHHEEITLLKEKADIRREDWQAPENK